MMVVKEGWAVGWAVDPVEGGMVGTKEGSAVE